MDLGMQLDLLQQRRRKAPQQQLPLKKEEEEEPVTPAAAAAAAEENEYIADADAADMEWVSRHSQLDDVLRQNHLGRYEVVAQGLCMRGAALVSYKGEPRWDAQTRLEMQQVTRKAVNCIHNL
jgi:hypothetical protein